MNLTTSLRQAHFQDIIFDLDQLDFFKSLEDKYFYNPKWKSMKPTIKLIDAHCKALIKSYEIKHGQRVSVGLVRRLLK